LGSSSATTLFPSDESYFLVPSGEDYIAICDNTDNSSSADL